MKLFVGKKNLDILRNRFSDAMLTVMDKLPSIKLGEFTLEFELGPLSPELQEIARKELRETPELQKESMERFKELLRGIIDLNNSSSKI